jgi:four helix bundle protein
MGATSFTQLNVWKKAHQVTLDVYKLTKKFPDDERYGLSVQMRKAAVSIPANIAEGFGRRKPQDKVRFYNISQGSAEELKYFCILSKDLGYAANVKDLWDALEEVSRMLRGLCASILDA